MSLPTFTEYYTILKNVEESIDFNDGTLEGFFEMFPCRSKAGNIGRLQDDGTVVITKSMAERLFGGPEESIGKPIILNKFGSKEDPSYYSTLQVSAVIDDFDNSIFMSAGIVINYEAGARCVRPTFSPQIFVKTDGSVSRMELSEKIRQIIDEYCTEEPHWNPEYSYAPILLDFFCQIQRISSTQPLRLIGRMVRRGNSSARL